jgi:hypothetical protein
LSFKKLVNYVTKCYNVIMIDRCSGCEGPQYELCNSVRVEFRDNINDVTRGAISGLAFGEIPDIFDMQQQVGQQQAVMISKMAEIGCGLSPPDLITTLQSETAAAATLFVADVMDEAQAEIDAEDAAREARILALLGQSEVLLRGGRTLLNRLQEDPTERAEREAKNRATAVSTYCEQQGWDSKSLDFSQRLDLRMHLKSIGLE